MNINTQPLAFKSAFLYLQREDASKFKEHFTVTGKKDKNLKQESCEFKYETPGKAKAAIQCLLYNDVPFAFYNMPSVQYKKPAEKSAGTDYEFENIMSSKENINDILSNIEQKIEEEEEEKQNLLNQEICNNVSNKLSQSANNALRINLKLDTTKESDSFENPLDLDILNDEGSIPDWD